MRSIVRISGRAPSLTRSRILSFQKTVYRHYRMHGRSFPWRNTQNPYRILVSECMLQQTQVARVLQKYASFLTRFPNFQSLAKAPLRDVLVAWQGLGYNRRALALQQTAKIVVKKYGGTLPHNPDVLRALPGIGTATAGALCAFAFDTPVPFVETNIRRVFIHSFFARRISVCDGKILELVARTLDRKNPREWYWALMDYGAMLAETLPKNPNRKSAHYRTQPAFLGSRRKLRGEIVRFLNDAQRASSAEMIAKKLKEPFSRVTQTLATLKKEGFLQKTGARFALRS